MREGHLPSVLVAGMAAGAGLVGVFFFPAAVMLAVAAVKVWRERPEFRPGEPSHELSKRRDDSGRGAGSALAQAGSGLGIGSWRR